MLRPELPAHLRAEYQAYRTADRALTRATRTGYTTGLVEAMEQFMALLPRRQRTVRRAACPSCFATHAGEC